MLLLSSMNEVEWPQDIPILFVGGQGPEYMWGHTNSITPLVLDVLRQYHISQHECAYYTVSKEASPDFLAIVRPLKIVSLGEEANLWCRFLELNGFERIIYLSGSWNRGHETWLPINFECQRLASLLVGENY